MDGASGPFPAYLAAAAPVVAAPVEPSEEAKLREAIGAIDPDVLTPREALEALNRLKALADDSV